MIGSQSPQRGHVFSAEQCLRWTLRGLTEDKKRKRRKGRVEEKDEEKRKEIKRRGEEKRGQKRKGEDGLEE